MYRVNTLDHAFVKSLGKYDLVYSWGVLYNTGNCYKAFKSKLYWSRILVSF